MRIGGPRWRLTRVRGCPVQIWLLAPQPASGTKTRVLGRRLVDGIPIGSVLSATWFEAWLFAHHPSATNTPRPIEYVYPEYCGIVSETFCNCLEDGQCWYCYRGQHDECSAAAHGNPHAYCPLEFARRNAIAVLPPYPDA